ncbi:hypothetical protein BCR35DRAFT_352661 [Leucosporidium creatinivorum]|uniref:BZIP domain-containing protein n=1 Tax=Leucosporidium creatinivorum TaxID=106004 RepID=A0A1Y2F7Y3_9BASI|nr:hypothetical protein BCR35DRAFT_352661 [Leucosporidium creatinivorum]
MAAQFASSSVAGPAYEYYQQPSYPHNTAYPAPVAQWSRQQQHPASSPALWGEFNPVAHPTPTARSSVVEMSYTSESPIMNDQQWQRRASEGALPHLPLRQGSGGMGPESASSSLANWSFPSSSNAPSSAYQPTAMIPPPIAPSTFSANASPILAEQSLPELSHPQPYLPQPAPHGYYVSSAPPPPLPHHSPSTPTQPNPLTPHLGDSTFGQQQPSAAGKAANSKSPPSGSGHKRGRKPKNYVKTAEDERIEREEYLERNRLAALKSRQRKKQRMGNLEAQAVEYSAHNDSLQKYALTLQSELLHLRSILSQLGGQSFPDVDGYLEREANGGGIPTILSIAGPTLERDYQAAGRA